jgi:coenzyme F420-reducing hydrogenase alpha subunit
MRSNFEAIKRAAERGVPLAKRALETITKSVETLEDTCERLHLVKPNKEDLTEKVSEAVVTADPWLASSLDGRRYRYKQRELEAA